MTAKELFCILIGFLGLKKFCRKNHDANSKKKGFWFTDVLNLARILSSCLSSSQAAHVCLYFGENR